VTSIGTLVLLHGATSTTSYDWLAQSGVTTVPLVSAIFLLATNGRTLKLPVPRFPWRATFLLVGSFLAGVAILARANLGIAAPRGAASIVGFVAVGPLIEELLFRGALYELIVERGSDRKAHQRAIIGTAIVFAIAHLGGYQFRFTDIAVRHVVLMLPTGMFLGWLRARSGSVWPSTAVHGLMNLVWLLVSPG
jgi:membrane protease YdiL (CAAX protease family)